MEVLTLALGLSVSLAAGARMHSNLSSHDEFVLDKLSNVLAYKRLPTLLSYNLILQIK